MKVGPDLVRHHVPTRCAAASTIARLQDEEGNQLSTVAPPLFAANINGCGLSPGSNGFVGRAARSNGFGHIAGRVSTHRYVRGGMADRARSVLRSASTRTRLVGGPGTLLARRHTGEFR